MTTVVPVTCLAVDQQGVPVANAVYTFKLTNYDIDDEIIISETTTATADANGVLVQNLWPNALGTKQSLYRVKGVHPTTQRKFFDAFVYIPIYPCNLVDCIILKPCGDFDPDTLNMIAMQALVAKLGNYWDLFHGNYYGPLDSDPDTDPWGYAINPGDMYYNTTLNAVYIYNGTIWHMINSSVNVGGVGSDGLTYMFENESVFPASYRLTPGRNAVSAGPITLSEGAVIEVPSTSTWVIV